RSIFDLLEGRATIRLPHRLRPYDGDVIGQRSGVRLVVRAAEHRWRFLGQQRVVRATPRLVEVIPVVQRLLPDEPQDRHPPTVHRLAVFIGDAGRRKALEDVVVILQTEADLLEVVEARVPPSGSGLLQCRQKQGEYDSNRATNY